MIVNMKQWLQSYKNNTILETQYRELLAATKCMDLACLRSVSSNEIVAAMQSSLDAGYLNHVYG